MTRWPLLNRNKVLDSTVHVPVESCAALENETVKTLAQKVGTCKAFVGYVLLMELSAPGSLEYSSCI